MADLLEEQTEPRSPPGAFGPKLLSAFSTSPSASPPSSFKRRTSWGEHQSGPPSRNSSRRSSRVQLDPHFTARRLPTASATLCSFVELHAQAAAREAGRREIPISESSEHLVMGIMAS